MILLSAMYRKFFLVTHEIIHGEVGVTKLLKLVTHTTRNRYLDNH